jgi:hypothetical protein
MELASLQKRTRRARDEIAREKAQLLLRTWTRVSAQAADKAVAAIVIASEQVEQKALRAADQGRSGTVLLRLSFQYCDLRHELQAELHASRLEDPDPYPRLRSLGPPSFGEIEEWLRSDLQVKQMERVCPLDWLEDLSRWLRKQEKAGALTRWLQRRPVLPQPLEELWKQCQRQGLKPRYESYRHQDESGIALVVHWQP